MAAVNYLSYAGLNAPVRLDGADALLPLLSAALPSWPVTVSDMAPSQQPFASLRGQSDGMYEINVYADASQARRWDAVNVVCDFVAEMAWEKLRSQPDLLCVHAAAVQFGDRLVVFPSSRRAGKSTLTCALAHQGQTVFTDDYLFIDIAADGAMNGTANGIAPRLRLPVPDGFSEVFNRWATADQGPSNKQYKYLTEAPLATGGASLALGAIVVLDRQDEPVTPRLDPIDQATAMDSMIIQNFARSLHAGIILQSIETLTANLPTYRLVYHCGEDAAAFLRSSELLHDLPVAKLVDAKPPTQAPLEELEQRPMPFDPVAAYVQRVGATESHIDGAHFLADRSGLAIHRLNSGSAAIWRLLAEPTSLQDVVEILTVAFPDTKPDQIAADSLAALQQLTAARLIEPAHEATP